MSRLLIRHHVYIFCIISNHIYLLKKQKNKIIIRIAYTANDTVTDFVETIS